MSTDVAAPASADDDDDDARCFCSVGAKLRERHFLVACTGEEVLELMAVRKPTEVDALSLHHHPLLWRSDCLSDRETSVCVFKCSLPRTPV